MTRRPVFALTALAAASLALAGCSSSPGTSNAGSQTIVVTDTATGAAAKPSPSAAASCSLPDNQDLIVRDDDPQASIIASEIGEVDLGNCVTELSEFQQTAGQGAGECTTIAWAKDNPGYDANSVPAPPLKDVIESAGPGC
ncbi:hypothetical protein KDL01_32475 [Actinospica durhamensis]|uniref:Secreted protein n=1 Tax=Actinospica durhamensis TaxID=1508375 RepID=A0A941IS32_9ACTN|nr:hypothetical protein [Actinospica durhamensis]MBR7838034.1 hypothetical protein [Actinospica durhamensis]